jgi:hypothetical protein
MEGMATMPRRLALCLLIAWLAWISPASAQGPGPQGPSGPGYYGMAPGRPYPGGAGSSDYTLQPTLEEQLVPQSRDIYGMDPYMDLGIAETFSRSWIRTDLLLMTFQEPNTNYIGATPTVIPPNTYNPSALFPAVDRVGGARDSQVGTLVNLANVDNRNIPGLRVTVGIPTQLSTLEVSGFMLAQANSNLFFPTTLDTSSFSTLGFSVLPAIPLQRVGSPTTLDYFFFDQGMTVNSSNDIQGTDAKFVMGAVTPNVEMEVFPIIGFNYFHFGNRLSITGEDLATSTNHMIQSKSNNQVFGPEIGLRLENRNKWFTLGFEPKFTFGINRMTGRVASSQIFSPTEADISLVESKTRFAPTIDLTAYSRIRFSEHCNLNLGYQFMAMAGASLSDQNIVWKSSNSVTGPALIGLQQDTHSFWMQGLNLGLEITF